MRPAPAPSAGGPLPLALALTDCVLPVAEPALSGPALFLGVFSVILNPLICVLLDLFVLNYITPLTPIYERSGSGRTFFCWICHFQITQARTFQKQVC